MFDEKRTTNRNSSSSSSWAEVATFRVIIEAPLTTAEATRQMNVATVMSGFESSALARLHVQKKKSSFSTHAHLTSQRLSCSVTVMPYASSDLEDITECERARI